MNHKKQRIKIGTVKHRLHNYIYVNTGLGREWRINTDTACLTGDLSTGSPVTIEEQASGKLKYMGKRRR